MTGRPSGWHRRQLIYCSNVHPGATMAQLRQVVERQLPAIRRLRGLEWQGSGLWLSAAVARRLVTERGALEQFETLLRNNRVLLFSLNGFPCGDFHQRVVKQRVYHPDWSDPARLDYTLDLARVLARCLPREQEQGTISTLPLGFGPEWTRRRQGQAVRHLRTLAEALSRLREQSGRQIRVCLEMEPGCVLERTGQLIDFFHQALSDTPATDHLGVCYDVCHQAVMFEHPADSLEQISAAGIHLGKIQISSALQADHPALPEQRAALARFDEPRYLHQVCSLQADGSLAESMDLPRALAGEITDQSPWRIHFHVPIQHRGNIDGTLNTTQEAILQVLDWLTANPRQRPHLEVETYSWQVLPGALRPNDDTALQQGIAGELEWLEQALEQRELMTREAP